VERVVNSGTCRKHFLDYLKLEIVLAISTISRIYPHLFKRLCKPILGLDSGGGY
jgi:hypothetical protein